MLDHNEPKATSCTRMTGMNKKQETSFQIFFLDKKFGHPPKLSNICDSELAAVPEAMFDTWPNDMTRNGVNYNVLAYSILMYAKLKNLITIVKRKNSCPQIIAQAMAWRPGWNLQTCLSSNNSVNFIILPHYSRYLNLFHDLRSLRHILPLCMWTSGLA